MPHRPPSASGRALRSIALALLLVIPMASARGADADAARIVSLNPSLTSILIAIGAGDRLVGVDEFSARIEPGIAQLPRVGGLYNPSLEAVVALQPDRVVLVPSVEQRDFRRRLEELSIEVSVFENISLDQVMENIARLGRMTGREEAARARVAEVRATWKRVRRLATAYPSPRAVLILQRDPVFVIGRGSFIDEMLQALGAENPAAEFQDPYPRVAMEWLVAAKPTVLVDLSPDPEEAASYWSRWPTLAAGRVVELEPDAISLPGPYLDRSLETLAVAVHGPEFERALAKDRGESAMVSEP